MSNSTIEDAGSLKASSNFSEEWYSYDPNKHYARRRAVEVVRPKITGANSTLAVDLLKRSLKTVEDRGGSEEQCTSAFSRNHSMVV